MEFVLLVSAPLTSRTVDRKRLRQVSSKNGNLKKFWMCLDQSLQGNREYYVNKRNGCNSGSQIYSSSGERLPLIPEKIVKSESLLPDNSTLSALLLYYARNGLLSKASEIWEQMLNSSFMPDAEVVSQLIFLYGGMGDFGMVAKILHQMQLKDSALLPGIYSLAISCFGKSGQLDYMEIMIKWMVSMGYSVDSTMGNAYLLYYSTFGSLADAESAYGRLKKSRILIEEEGIRALSFAYIKENKFYALGRFVHDVGLGRKNVGNLLWNLLLLSYAANFKMKSLQREFVRMVEAGFHPDLSTFNIRLLAFSRMSLLWDLHLSLEHMKHEAVVPDLVTYGCVVDAYMDRKLGKNLKFALRKLNWNDCVSVLTDPLVFEAMGKGDFHLNSEVVMEYVKKKDWTYKMIIAIYLKKKFRSNQIFWNY
ncbi:pentatricopeptide repeat-containing protein At3g42630 isoform X1 [Sesamum indicum]|uniref:Pentatricopeptide repeat-containing protein At3g42630 isoform X1 n=1 Tax=Sesamum indicum TaxID=4182 RepID=A0A6I9U1M9_SESIN|nr:pentatricopeptide repeat-containing protein At3g42630 isoform X1 [Sesamum indicum]